MHAEEEYRLQTSSRWMRLLLLGWRQAQAPLLSNADHAVVCGACRG